MDTYHHLKPRDRTCVEPVRQVLPIISNYSEPCLGFVTRPVFYQGSFFASSHKQLTRLLPQICLRTGFISFNISHIEKCRADVTTSPMEMFEFLPRLNSLTKNILTLSHYLQTAKNSKVNGMIDVRIDVETHRVGLK